MLVSRSQATRMAASFRTILYLVSAACIIAFLIEQTTDMPISFPPWFGSRTPWKEVVAAKTNRDMAKIPKAWVLHADVIEDARDRRQIAGEFFDSLLDEESRRITAMDASELLQNLAEAQLSAVQVTIAFSKRAAYVHQITNILLEIGFDLALEQAQDLDLYFAKHNRLIGPLHGLPVTLKDQFHIKGLETSAAYVGWIGTFEGKRGTGKEKVFESELIRELKFLGAVPIGKANITCNGHMGEGAMQALRGSVFGFGTDIGGSVSMPASYQGVFSLKPSAGRISFKGGAQIVNKSCLLL
ncbi:hypothetical protein G7Z17_g6835 [Cylindrodendrum hubeiense]|uniref:Amidase domain-containing protein n=1 Tax=Cylindrodendrum hubeiense TaxID=595255 RepID=A0A9P5LAG4_9HYPO|nr:hypothetical protein G7Z17_g6835 [Cylindrodendrum hubeiense]